MSRSITFSPEEFYHVYNRGVDKRNIFNDHSDYARFSALLYAMNATNTIRLNNEERRCDSVTDIYQIERENTLISIVGYCLMPNHYHLLIREKDPSGISKFMQKLSTGYSMYFNKRHERSGVLFQGKFKAKHVDTDVYLKYLFSYITLNPIDLMQSDWETSGIENHENAQKFLNEYLYSSYIDYRGISRPETAIISPESAPSYHLSIQDLENEMLDWLEIHQPVS